MEGFTQVAVFTYPHELAVVRARLEDEGIQCLTRDEHTVSAHPFMSNAIGGIKLLVPDADALYARQLVEEAGFGADQVGRPVEPDPLEQIAKRMRIPMLPPGMARKLALVLVALLLLAAVLLA
jgi:hypothetical protein